MKRKKYAVILAGGHGTRMGNSTPKQFLEIGGKPILRHTIEKFIDYQEDTSIILILPSELKEYWKNYCRENNFLDSYIMAAGGITRFHSVQNALKFVPEGALVAVHDGVRPLIDNDLLERLFSEAESAPAVVPTMPVEESLREIDGNGNSFRVDRSLYYTVQTPQVFHSEVLKAAYENPYSPSFTDDASVVEAAGIHVSLVRGKKHNIKITTPEDLELASLLLAR